MYTHYNILYHAVAYDRNEIAVKSIETYRDYVFSRA